MTTIEQLKDNRYSYGMWTEPECYGPELGKEMQEKAEEIGKDGNFLYWNGREFEAVYGDIFFPAETYRLRPDYEEEPSIVECEITDTADGYRVYSGDGDKGMGIHAVYRRSNFIGFKFEDGTVRPVPVTYLRKDGHKDSSSHITCTDDTVLHATHVVFRGQK